MYECYTDGDMRNAENNQMAEEKKNHIGQPNPFRVEICQYRT